MSNNPQPADSPSTADMRNWWKLPGKSVAKVASIVQGKTLRPGAADVIFGQHVEKAEDGLRAGSKQVKATVARKVDKPLAKAGKDVEPLTRYEETKRIKLESGAVMTLHDARVSMAADKAKIDADIAAGNGAHHEGTSFWTKVLPYLLAVLEVIMLSLLFREIANAWGSVLRMVATYVLPVALVALQFALIRQIARAENTRREAVAEGNMAAEINAQRTYRRWLAPAVLVALLAASLVAFRVYTWMTSSPHPVAEVVLMTIFGFLAGLAPSVVKYLAVARDGSTTSRRYADTALQVARAEKQRERMDQRAAAQLAKADNANFAVKTGKFATLSHQLGRVFDLPWREWGAAHAMIGVEPPSKPQPQFIAVTHLDRGTGQPSRVEQVPLPFIEIPGSRQPDLMPAQVAYGVIVDADRRIAALRAQLEASRRRDGEAEPPQLAITGA